MVAYSFKARFENLIVEGLKQQTIRANRKRHARPGEPVQLFCAMRTKHCRKLVSPDPVCFSVLSIRIEIDCAVKGYVRSIVLDGELLCDADVGALARADGFADTLEFGRFWYDTHGDGVFEGVLIRWREREE